MYLSEDRRLRLRLLSELAVTIEIRKIIEYMCFRETPISYIQCNVGGTISISFWSLFEFASNINIYVKSDCYCYFKYRMSESPECLPPSLTLSLFLLPPSSYILTSNDCIDTLKGCVGPPCTPKMQFQFPKTYQFQNSRRQDFKSSYNLERL